MMLQSKFGRAMLVFCKAALLQSLEPGSYYRWGLQCIGRASLNG